MDDALVLNNIVSMYEYYHEVLILVVMDDALVLYCAIKCRDHMKES